jgi:hypothetical protein
LRRSKGLHVSRPGSQVGLTRHRRAQYLGGVGVGGADARAVFPIYSASRSVAIASTPGPMFHSLASGPRMGPRTIGARLARAKCGSPSTTFRRGSHAGLSRRRPKTADSTSTDADITPTFHTHARRCSFVRAPAAELNKREDSINLRRWDFCPICRAETVYCSHLKAMRKFRTCSSSCAMERWK